MTVSSSKPKTKILVNIKTLDIVLKEYSTTTTFLTYLVALNTTNVQTGCNDTVIDAISAVFNVEIISPKSPILVITDAPPDDAADYLTIINRNTYRKLPVSLSTVIKNGVLNTYVNFRFSSSTSPTLLVAAALIQ